MSLPDPPGLGFLSGRKDLEHDDAPVGSDQVGIGGDLAGISHVRGREPGDGHLLGGNGDPGRVGPGEPPRSLVEGFPIRGEGIVGLIDLDRLFLRAVVLEPDVALERLARGANLLLSQAVDDPDLGPGGGRAEEEGENGDQNGSRRSQKLRVSHRGLPF